MPKSYLCVLTDKQGHVELGLLYSKDTLCTSHKDVHVYSACLVVLDQTI